jgi:hypothetical protein
MIVPEPLMEGVMVDRRVVDCGTNPFAPQLIYHLVPDVRRHPNLIEVESVSLIDSRPRSLDEPDPRLVCEQLVVAIGEPLPGGEKALELGQLR